MKNTPSLMEAPVVATPILDQFRKALTPSSGKEPTLEEKLSALSEPDLKTVMAQSRIAHMSARMQRKVHGAPPETYGELLQSMYPKSNNDLLSLVAEVLQETDPILEESIVPRYKKKPKFEREAAAQFYVDSLKPKQSDVNQFIADAGLEQGDEQLEFMFNGDADEV